MEVNEISTTITMLPKDDFEAPKVPEDIILEILVRLPVKSLLKFMCVSKLRLSLISSCEFAKAHLKFSTKNNIYVHKLLFGSKYFPMDLYTCSFHSAFEYEGYIYPVADEDLLVDRVCFDYPLYESYCCIWLVGSCNGLVCVSTSDSHLILWNPITRKSKVLQDSGTKLIFEVCEIRHGFGFDALHDDYKVVEFFSFYADMVEHEIQVKVYNLRSNSWKTLSNWPGGDTFGGSAKFLNGAFHWSLIEGPLEEGWGIIAYDLSMDTFECLPMPDIEHADAIWR